MSIRAITQWYGAFTRVRSVPEAVATGFAPRDSRSYGVSRPSSTGGPRQTEADPLRTSHRLLTRLLFRSERISEQRINENIKPPLQFPNCHGSALRNKYAKSDTYTLGQCCAHTGDSRANRNHIRPIRRSVFRLSQRSLFKRR